MTSATPPSTAASGSKSSSEDEPVHIELEFVRAKEADDAFAFRFTRQTYLVRGRQGAYETAELPWNKELLRDLEEVRRPDRDPATVARVGALLREFLDPAGWGAHESTIVQARTDRRRVHLTIRSAAAELYALPWELLTLRADGQHLGALDHLLLRYAWPGTSTISASDPTGADSRRVLMAWSAAGGAVPAADQTKAIEAAVQNAGGEVEVLGNATYGQVADALEAAEGDERPFTALHLLCHGAEAGSTFGLSFDAEDGGRPVVVDAGRLQQLLSPHAHRLRLVVVAACDGGNMGEPGNRIGSVAQRLHRAGIQYVVASRYPLSARGSTRMTGALYEALYGGASVERAFVQARTAASREVSQLDWASLQLYARPEDGDRGAVLAPAPAPAVAPAVAPEAAPVPVTAVATTAPSGGSSRALLAAIAGILVAGIGVIGYTTLRNSGAADDAESQGHAALEAKAPTPERPPPAQTPPASGAPQDAKAAGSGGAADPADDDAAAPAADAPAPVGATDSTSGADPTPTPSKSTRSTRPRASSRSKPSKRCSAVTSFIKGAVDPSPGAQMEVWVFTDGTSKVHKCDGCEAKTKSGAKGLRASKLTSNSKRSQELPCRAIVKW